MFITAIIWKMFLFVLKNCIHCVKKGNVVQLSFHVGASSYSPNRSIEEKVELVCLGFFFCSVQAAHTNGSCRGCFLDWTIFPLFNYVFIALLFTPEEIGNTWLLTAVARSFAIHSQYINFSLFWSQPPHPKKCLFHSLLWLLCCV